MSSITGEWVSLSLHSAPGSDALDQYIHVASLTSSWRLSCSSNPWACPLVLYITPKFFNLSSSALGLVFMATLTRHGHVSPSCTSSSTSTCRALGSCCSYWIRCKFAAHMGQSNARIWLYCTLHLAYSWQLAKNATSRLPTGNWTRTLDL